MGFLDLFKKKTNTRLMYANMLNGSTPLFAQFGQNIYSSDVVQQAISCIVSECIKLIPKHVRLKGSDVIPIASNIQNVLDKPNEQMTTNDFIEKIIWSLFFNYNAFIIPTFYEWKDKESGLIKRHYTSLYPVQPSNIEFLRNSNDVLFVKMKFVNGYETTLNYNDVIHIRYNYSINDFMGGNATGQADVQSLLKTLNLNNDLLSGVQNAVKSSFSINGVIKINTMLDDGKTIEHLNELEKRLKNNESGFLPLDFKSDYIPINKDVKLVDPDTLKFIDEKILRHFNVPLPILKGDYTKEQYEAFYQKTIEPLVIKLSNAFTKTLFTERERSFGNAIKFYTKDLTFMTTTQVLEMVRLLGDSGGLYENEKRVFFGLEPLEELQGKRMMSLNYIDAQVGRIDNEQTRN